MSRYSCLTYVCGGCKRGNCKLWREFNTFLSHQVLRCASCALAHAELTGPIDDQGFRQGRYGKTDQIGSFIPAVPDEVPTADGRLSDNATYWGYTSVPGNMVAWWRALPT